MTEKKQIYSYELRKVQGEISSRFDKKVLLETKDDLQTLINLVDDRIASLDERPFKQYKLKIDLERLNLSRQKIRVT